MTKSVVLEQPLLQVLPMSSLMPLPHTLPEVPDQPVPFQGVVNLRFLDIRLLGTLPGYDNDIDDEKQPEVSIRQPDKTMYRKSKRMFDEIQDEMIFRKHLPRQLEINEFLESLKRKVMTMTQIKGHALSKLKTECEDYLVIDDVLFRIKLPKDKSIQPSLLLAKQKSMFLQSCTNIRIHCLQDINVLLNASYIKGEIL